MAAKLFSITALFLTAVALTTASPTSTFSPRSLAVRADPPEVQNGNFKLPLRDSNQWSYTVYGYRRVKYGNNWVLQFDHQDCPLSVENGIDGYLHGFNITNIIGGETYVFTFDYLFTTDTTYSWSGQYAVSLDPYGGPRFPKLRNTKFTQNAKANTWYTYSTEFKFKEKYGEAQRGSFNVNYEQCPDKLPPPTGDLQLDNFRVSAKA